ncbi:MAG TPA: glutamate--tRNA ligase [Candidatus Chromulinivoraceae bacterium]|nr:glutamate--tRNA ligase [Candidatus Chromulinivoraceae bacterium]
MTTVRTRFAPSPTGFLHVGNIRTGLFAYLVARHADGQFILRLEDTDKKREVEGSEAHLLKCLETLGITYDEGINLGGPYAPYKQSERLETYKEWAQKLIDDGRAYADPYTQDELQAFRDDAVANKQPFLYRNHRPEHPPTWDGTQPLRFKSDPKAYTWHDEVMGEISTGPEVIDDIILIKSDGYPTYNFAHIVDDAEMKVTHILRGQEFISSQPNYLNIYEALRLEHPVFATMPHIMAPTGGKKLGKRDGAKDVLDYIRDGILPEALLNFIASLGWNDGTEQEIFSKEELIAKFTLDRVQRSGARFDEQRLIWLNGQWMRRLSLDDLYSRVTDFWPESAKTADEAQRKQILGLVQDRLKTLHDLPLMTSYFFADPTPALTMISENKQLKKLSTQEITELLMAAKSALETCDFTPDAIQAALNNLLETTGQKPGVLFSLVRIAVSWAPFSPALNDTLAALGKETALRRLKNSIDSISAN